MLCFCCDQISTCDRSISRHLHCIKIEVFIKDFFSKCNLGLVTFTEEVLNEKLHFICCANFDGQLPDKEDVAQISEPSKEILYMT